MSPQVYSKRKTAIKLADTLNDIEGVPVSAYARELSDKWAKRRNHRTTDEGSSYRYAQEGVIYEGSVLH